MASRENGRIGNNRVPNKDHFCVEKSHLEGDSRTYVATAWFVEGNRADADIRKLTKAGEKEYIEDVVEPAGALRHKFGKLHRDDPWNGTKWPSLDRVVTIKEDAVQVECEINRPRPHNNTPCLHECHSG